jgi:hypothetical protein
MKLWKTNMEMPTLQNTVMVRGEIESQWIIQNAIFWNMLQKWKKISLPPKKKHPAYLEKLLNGDDNNSKNFKEHIISYNSMFSFASTGGIVDKGINTSYGPYVF